MIVQTTIWQRGIADVAANGEYSPFHAWHYLDRGDLHRPYPVDAIRPSAIVRPVLLLLDARPVAAQLASMLRAAQSQRAADREAYEAAVLGRAALGNWWLAPDDVKRKWAESMARATYSLSHTLGVLAGIEQELAALAARAAEEKRLLTEGNAMVTTGKVKKSKGETDGTGQKSRRQKDPNPQSPIPNPCSKTQSPIPKTQQRVWPADLDPAKIVPNPFQPRKDFPAAEIQALADTIAADGQIHPIAVRPRPDWPRDQDPLLCDRFEVADGERRLRAVGKLGWDSIRAEIGYHTDAQMRAIAMTSALQRKELNAIEEARAFRAAIDAGDVDGPTQLARRIGLSQGHISNRLRLLELPEKVQAKVISREILPTHARALVPYAHIPAIVAYVEDQFAGRADNVSAEEMDYIIEDAVRIGTRPLTGKVWPVVGHSGGQKVSVFKPAGDELARLQTYTIRSDDGQPETVCTNVELWKELQAAHEAKLAAKRGAKADGGQAKAEHGQGKAPTAAQQKAIDAEEARKATERAGKFAAGAWRVAIYWRRMLIARACRESQVGPEDLLRLLMFVAGSATCMRHGISNGSHEIGEREDCLAGVLRATRKSGGIDLWAALVAVGDREVDARGLAFIADLFWAADDGPKATIEDHDVLAIAEQLGIDCAAAWKADAAGDLTEDWLELHAKDALVEMGAKLGMKFDKLPKTSIVECLITHRKKLALPAVLLKPKKPKEL